MNIWDSVQRGLEKASQEAARIAKMQRLRAAIDTLSRQIYTQQVALINKTMELFDKGQITHNELLTICQDLSQMQQQNLSLQNELKIIQSQSAPTTQPNVSVSPTPSALPALPAPQESDGTPTVYAPPPPDFQFYSDTTVGVPAPPPPPGTGPQAISAINTVLMGNDSNQQSEGKLLCVVCRAGLIAGNAYCHNCGSPVVTAAAFPPTVRSTDAQTLPVEDKETVHSDMPQSSSGSAQSTPQDGGH